MNELIYIQRLETNDAHGASRRETAAAHSDLFPRGPARRMTQLGILVGSVLEPLTVREDEPLFYASVFGESQALAGFIDSFPIPSPQLFQTSIHPSAAEQYLIFKKQAVERFFPVLGSQNCVVSAIQFAASLLRETSSVLICGGEESGPEWLLERGLCSGRSFAYAFRLSAEPEGACASIELSELISYSSQLSHASWFDLIAHPSEEAERSFLKWL